MAIVLTETAKLLSEQTSIKVNIILEIEGFDYKFGTLGIEKELALDMPEKYLDNDLYLDSKTQDPNSRPWVTLGGTTKTVTSQLKLDAGVEAIRSFNIELLDKAKELSDIFTPGNTVPDLLGQKAKVYLNLVGSSHPIDSILLMEGIVGQYNFTGKGTVIVTVDHASQLKRQEIFVSHQTELDGDLANTETSTISVNDASGFLEPTDEFLTYVKIDEEIIRYTGVSGNTLTGITREQLETLKPTTHDDDTEVTSFYRLQGNAIDLALKVMLSGGGYGLEKTTTAFNQLTDEVFVDNAIVFESKDIEQELGLVVGDKLQITASDSNNITTTIKDFGKIDSSNSYIIVNDSLTTDTGQSATVKFKSKYDVLPQGAGLLPTQLDVQGHLYWYNLFSGNFAEMDFYLEEEVKVDEFVNEQLYRPTNLYSIPGNRAGVKMTVPPLSDINTKRLNSTNIVNPNNINVTRSVKRYSYNTVIYKIDPDRLNLDKYLTGKVVIDNDSLNRLRAGKKVFKVESQGLRRDSITMQTIGINARRFLDRYRFAAEFFSLETFFSNIDIECGDVVVVEGTNIYDSETGSRNFRPRLFEVINKSINIGQAKIKLDLLSTSFGTDGRVGVVSPASKIDSGATTTRIPLKSSFGFDDPEHEKWEGHIGATVRIHNNDWTYNETTKITGFDEDNQNVAIVDALSTAPSEDYILDTADYFDADNDEQDLIRDMYCFADPTVDIDSVTDAKTFTVSSSNASRFFVGGFVEVVKNDYTFLSEGKVASVTSTGGATETITLEEDLSFTPASGDKVQLIGFSDTKGKPYRIL